MSKRQRKGKGKTILLLAVMCIAVQSVSVLDLPIRWNQSVSGSQVKEQIGNNVTVISSEIDTPWRYTNQGWQRANEWNSNVQFEPLRTFELVHPFVWAASVLLAVISTAIWASSEWEIARLLGRDE